MLRHSLRARWLPWRQALVFGLPLAFLELSLFVVSMAYSSRLLPPQAVLIGLPLYLVIPAISSYWFHHQRQHESWVGFRVGFVGFAVFLLAVGLVFAVMFMRYINTPHIFTPGAPHRWGLYDPARELGTLASVLGVLALFNSVGLLLSAIGGRIGAALAIWRATSHASPTQPQA